MRGLQERGHEVVGLSRRGPDVRWDITRGELPRAPAVDAVVHCAALLRDGRLSHDHIAVNVEGTRSVLRTFPGARLIHMSSASVYDPWVPKACVREDAPPPRRWLNGYGQTKRAAEELVSRLRPDATILRPHAVYGPGDTTLLPRILRARVGGRQLAIGDGSNLVTLTSVDNLVDAVSASLRHPGACGAFNVGDADTPSVGQVLVHLLGALGLPVTIIWIPRPVAWRGALVSERLAGSREPWLSRYTVNQLSLTFTLSLDRIRQQLNWEPMQTYQSGFAGLRDQAFSQEMLARPGMGT
jgi:nucleoside-diphosphate-sugar epimerase